MTVLSLDSEQSFSLWTTELVCGVGSNHCGRQTAHCCMLGWSLQHL